MHALYTRATGFGYTARPPRVYANRACDQVREASECIEQAVLPQLETLKLLVQSPALAIAAAFVVVTRLLFST